MMSLLFVVLANAVAESLPPISAALPFDISYFTNTVASVQNTYCPASDNYQGFQVGDQSLYASIVLGDGAERVNIYDSQSLGIVVAYQGTNVTNFESIISDVEVVQVPADLQLGLPLGALIYAGWQNQWRKTWFQVQDALQERLSALPNRQRSVVVVGHSQGAAIAQLGALAIANTFGDVIDKIIGYGPPRVGNLAYAEGFDSIFLGRYTGVTNGEDWVYSVPPKVLGYVHPTGMVWINPANSTSWTFYNDREDPRGPDAHVPEYVSASSILRPPYLYFRDHLGIYMHSSLGGRKAGPCPAMVGGY